MGINMYKAPQMVGLLSLYLPHYMPSAFHMGNQSSVIVLTFLKEAMELAELQRRNESQKLRVGGKRCGTTLTLTDSAH